MKKTVIKIVLWAVTVTLMSTIFILSGQDADRSMDTSRVIANPVTDKVIENRNDGKDAPLTEKERKVTYSQTISQVDGIIRKIAHMSEYFFLAISVYLLCVIYSQSTTACIMTAAFVSLFFALTDEFHQMFTEGRSGEITDVFIDFIGAAVGIAVITVLIPIIKKILSKRKKEYKL